MEPKIERKKITDLKQDPANANQGSERGLRILDDSIAETGAGRSGLVDKNGYLLAGNKTQERLVDRGIDDVIVVHTDGKQWVVVQRDDLDLTDPDPDNAARRAAYYDNVAGQHMAWDVARILADAEAGVNLKKMFTSDEMAAFLAQAQKDGRSPQGDAGARMDQAEALQQIWQVAPGDLWDIPGKHGGVHRLLCGDSTRAEDVARVLAGETPVLMVTDPPYGVEYDQSFRSQNRVGTVTNDDRADWREAYALSNAAIAYVWHASRFAHVVVAGLDAIGYEIRSQIVWNKSKLVLGRGHYHFKHEPCWYAVKKGSQAFWIGDCKQSTVWDIDLSEDVPGGHSTQKPVECMARPIRNHDAPLVYDPFMGSGTTFVAAEQLGRRALGVEVAPAYCAVILQRMADMGLAPVRTEPGTGG